MIDVKGFLGTQSHAYVGFISLKSDVIEGYDYNES